jgi:putative transposase
MQLKAAHGADLRRGRVSIQNQVYLVTTVIRNRQLLLGNLYRGRIVVQALQYAADCGHATTLAYVVMPDHLHWLLSLGCEVTLPDVVSYMKRHTSRQINLQRGAAGKGIWQHGFHDHALRHEEALLDVARYIVANPLRAGLVNSVREYSLWDVVWL